jgi:hypothetical protein
MTTPKKRAFRIGKLNTVGQVCGELARLYKRTAHGHLDSNDAARQSSILAKSQGWPRKWHRRAATQHHRRPNPAPRIQSTSRAVTQQLHSETR